MATDRKFIVKNGLQAQNIDFVDSTTATPTATLTASMNGSSVLSFDSGTFEIDGANNTVSTGGNLSVNGDSAFKGTFSYHDMIWDKSDNSLKLPDNTSLKIGSGSNFNNGDLDVKMWHNGTGFNLKSFSGDYVWITSEQADSFVAISADDGTGTGTAAYFQAIGSTGEATLHHYGSEKLATKSTGIELTGNITNSASGVVANFGPATSLAGTAPQINFNVSQGASNSNYVVFESDYSAGGESHWHSYYSQNNGVNGALARFDFNGHDSAGNDTMYGLQKFYIKNGTDGSECGAYQLSLIKDDNVSGSGTAGLIDAINIDTSDVTLSNKGVNNGIYRVFGLDLYLQGNASQGYPNLVFDTGTYDTTFTMTTATAERVITFPDASGTVVTTGNADVGATTTSSSDADHVLIDDGGVLKKITPANLGIGAGGSGAGSTYALIQIFG